MPYGHTLEDCASAVWYACRAMRGHQEITQAERAQVRADLETIARIVPGALAGVARDGAAAVPWIARVTHAAAIIQLPLRRDTPR